MRSKARLLLAAALAVGSLATAAAVATGSPALAVCRPTSDTCSGSVPPPPPPPPPVQLSAPDLIGRSGDVSLGPIPPATIQVGAKERFTVMAQSRVSGATVALGGEDRFTCAAPNGVQVTFDYTYTPSFTASPNSATRQPFSCPAGIRSRRAATRYMPRPRTQAEPSSRRHRPRSTSSRVTSRSTT